MDEPFAVMSCEGCGLVRVALAAFEVHTGAGASVFAYTCPRCGLVGSGTGAAFIRALLERGVTQHRLRCIAPDDAGTEEQVAELRAWLDRDPAWD